MYEGLRSQEAFNSNWNFWWELTLQVRVIFFSWDLNMPCTKNNEYGFQTKIMILNVFHYWSRTLKTVWKSVLVSLFFIVYSTPTRNIFLSRGLKCFCFLQLGARKFQISWGPSVLGEPNFHFRRSRVGLFSSIKPSMTNHVNSRIVGKLSV